MKTTDQIKAELTIGLNRATNEILFNSLVEANAEIERLKNELNAALNPDNPQANG